MRIIAGLYRGSILKTLRGRALRPSSARLREALFNVLGAAVEGAVFLDGYAGSGAVGLEALSRGARQVFLIEENAAANRVIRANLSALGARRNVEILGVSVRKGLRLLERRGVRADFCFLDPPYAARRECAKSLLELSASRVMAPGGMILLEHSRKDTMQPPLEGWKRIRVLAQGSSALSFYRAA